MRKRVVSVALAVALAVAPLGVVSTASAAPLSASDLQTLALRSAASSNDANANDVATVADDAAVNGWTIDRNTAKGGEILAAGTGDYAGWTHFKSTSANGNATSSSGYPAVAISGKTIDLTRAGEFSIKVKSPQAGSANRFGFYLGYKDPGNALFLGYDKGGWFWQKYVGGNGDWYNGTRVAAPAANAEITVNVSWTAAKVATLTIDGQKAFDVDYSSMTALTDKLAMKAGSYSGTSEVTDVYFKNFTVGEVAKHNVTGKVVDASGAAIAGAEVVTGKNSATTAADGTFTLTGLAAGDYTLTVSAEGYDDATKTVTVADGNASVGNITLNKSAEVATETLSTAAMDVRVKKNFPSVYDYTMKKLDGKIMYGQPKDVRVITINGTDVTLKDSDVTFKKVSATEAQYTLNVKSGDKINAVVTVQIKVVDNTLKLNVTKIVNKADDAKTEAEENPVQTIAFPNQSLISVRSGQDGAQFTGARMSSDTARPGDTTSTSPPTPRSAMRTTTPTASSRAMA